MLKLLPNIYILKLNENRNGFIFESENLKDLIVNIDPENTYGNFHESMDEIMFGKNFGVITDLKLWLKSATDEIKINFPKKKSIIKERINVIKITIIVFLKKEIPDLI